MKPGGTSLTERGHHSAKQWASPRYLLTKYGAAQCTIRYIKRRLVDILIVRTEPCNCAYLTSASPISLVGLSSYHRARLSLISCVPDTTVETVELERYAGATQPKTEW